MGASFTNVPGGTANWTFTDVTGNYNNKSGTAAIVISKVDPTCAVNGFTHPYNGAAHGATGSCKGVGDVVLAFLMIRPPLRSTLFPYTTFFRSDVTGNYNNKSGTAAIVISK